MVKLKYVRIMNLNQETLRIQIKVWNMVNGQNILTYPALYKSEITALVNLDGAKIMLSVGWSKKIIKYPTEFGEVLHSETIIWELILL